MQARPSFLQISKQPAALRQAAGGAGQQAYQPLLGLWLIDLALAGRWVESPPSGSLRSTFCDDDFLRVTGLKGVRKLLSGDEDDDEELRQLDRWLAALDVDEDDEDVPLLPKACHAAKRGKPAEKVQQALSQLLLHRRKALLKKPMDYRLPLFQNIERAGRLLSLNDAERAVLAFAACVSCFQDFHDALMAQQIRVSTGQLAEWVSTLSGQPLAEVRKALQRQSVLMTAGIVKLERNEADLEDKLQLTRGLRDVILEPLHSDEDLGARLLRQPTPATLSLEAFPHLAQDIALLRDYLRHVLRAGVRGSNVLLYGPPGCGKTELAKALAADLGVTLYEIAHADEDGDPIDGEQRLQNFNFCQHALRGKPQVALLFDEMEDVLSGDSGPTNLFGFSPWKGQRQGGKAWINRTLEDNPIPTLWITNDADIDPAYLRRFDYALPLKVPPRAVRAGIVARYLGPCGGTPHALAALADLDDLLPAQLERAARVARFAGQDHQDPPGLTWQRVEQTLLRSRAVLGQPRVSLKPKIQTAYDLEFLQTDADIPGLIAALQNQNAPQARLCLYGPPGTGKSLLARHVADALGMPLRQKRASDLLDKYVGETEQRIAAMFEAAQDEGAVLLLDEADSFLSDRLGAGQAWEVTQTNEFLTQLEAFDGVFFATTNLIDQLDPAVLRRFSHKVRFDVLTAAQRWRLFQQETARLGIAPKEGSAEQSALQAAVQRLDGLTPGDMAAALQRVKLSSQVPTATALCEALAAEVRVKRHGKGPMGFV